MQESSPSGPDIITIEQERRESWYELKSDYEVITKLTELLRGSISNTDLNAVGEFKLSRIINNHIHSSHKYPWPVIVESFERNTEGQIVKINCSTNSVSKDDEPHRLEFSITI